MRIDNLARAFDTKRCARFPGGLSSLPAQELYSSSFPSIPGSDVAAAFGFLVHYTTRDSLIQIRRSGFIGGSSGCWLTPTGYSGCMVPYDLGLNTARDICLIVNVAGVADLWGLGTAPPGSLVSIWKGGGIEFYSHQPIDFTNVVMMSTCGTCGDPHR